MALILKSIKTLRSIIKKFACTRFLKKMNLLGFLYTDFFPRKSKQQGAWATSYLDQGLFHKKVRRPIAALVCNLNKGTKEKAALLNFV